MVMNQYLSTLQQQANDFNAHLALFQESVTVLIIACVVSIEILWMRRLAVIQ